MSINEYSDLLKLLDLKFDNLDLLQEAFIHRSYLNEVRQDLNSNERLEFLGDSVLSLIISRHLYFQRLEDAEGELTNLRAYIVKTKSLAEAAKKLALGKYLKMSHGEIISGGRENPQLLANTFEALLGAVFLDQGITGATKLISNSLLPMFEQEIRLGPPQDAKSSLQESAQDKLKQSPIYKTLKTYGPDHAKKFLVAVYLEGKDVGRGEGSSKQEAEEKAAQIALKSLSHK
jgi:ribonuclease III